MESRLMGRLRAVALTVFLLSCNWALAAAAPEGDGAQPLQEIGGCTPVIQVTPESLDFGDVAVGATSQLNISIEDVETNPECSIEIQNITLDSGAPNFELLGLGGFPFSIPVGTPFTFQVRFAPPSSGPFTGQITITSNDPARPTVTVALAGNGIKNQLPICNAGGPYTGNVNQEIVFDGSGSSDPDGSIDTYAWNFGDGSTGTGTTPSHTYTAKGTFTVSLTVTDNAAGTSTCETTATISGGGGGDTITVTAPNGGEEFMPGETTTITWTVEGTGVPNVDIELSTDGGTTFNAIAPGEANDGSFDWLVPGDNPTTQAIIRVRDPDGDPSDVSDAPFTINGVVVTRPNGGKSFVINTVEAITWNAIGTEITNVRIELSTDAGFSFTDIIASTENDGTFDWTVTGPATTEALVRISDAANALADDISDAVFTIVEEGGPLPPICNAGGPYVGSINIPVAFDGSGSSDDGTIVTYAWDFGDGSTDTSGPTPTHTYLTAGTFTVTLTLTDDENLTSTCSVTAEISDVQGTPPVCNAGGPYSGNVGVDIQLDGSGSSDPDGTIVSYTWDFGDGSTGKGSAPTHAYQSAGQFTVTLTLTDDDNLSSTCTTLADIIGKGQPPTCSAGGPYTGIVNQPVAFDGSGSSDPDGSITSYAWDFGDGSTDFGSNPTHTYLSAGTFTVSLTVTDDDSLTSTCSTTADITKDGGLPPNCNAGGPYTGNVNESVQFDGSGSSDPDGTIVSYTWDFGDGSTETGSNPTHTYTSAGTFTVSLTLVDDDNMTSTCTTTAEITGVGPLPPECDAGGPYSGEVNESITFDATDSQDPDGTIVAYHWDFGDGSIDDSGAEPSHTYTTTGTFTVTLTVTDDQNLTSTCTAEATIIEAGKVIRVALPERTFGNPNADVTIPVFVLDDLTGLGVFSAEFTIEYDRRVIRARDVSFAGTIGENATVEVDVDNLGDNRGIIRVSAAWIEALEGCEELAFVLFQATDTQDRETDLDLEITFNEGTPETEDIDGSFIKGLLGDVNCSTNLSALDASLLLRQTIGLIELPDSDFPCFTVDTGDVSDNGSLTAFDASLILRFILGEIDEFPAEENGELQCGVPGRTIAAQRLSRALSLAAGTPAGDGTYEVRVSIDDLAQVFGADLVLDFDPAQVRVLAVASALEGADNAVVESRIGDGEVAIGVALAGARSGSADLVRLTVAPVGATAGAANSVRLARASLNEDTIATNVKSGTLAGAPTVREVALAQNRPNPFNPSTVIAFAIPTTGRVDLSVYDAAGRRVRTLVSSSLPAGEHQAQWDGRDDSGHPVAAGVYLSILDAAGTQMTRKMILLK